MAETETAETGNEAFSTRQRLLELWEKCPECRPNELGCRDYSWGHQWHISGQWVSVPVAFALARDAMVRWLAERKPHDFVRVQFWTDCWWVSTADLDAPLREWGGTTLTDALISAVEAVLDNDHED